MNANQRRLQKRAFPHMVIISERLCEHQSDSDFDDRIHEAKIWLQSQCKTMSNDWTCRKYAPDSETFFFRKSSLAVIFALKWA